jgi:cytochrome c556
MRKASWLFVLLTATFLAMGASAVTAAEFDKVIEGRQQLMKDIGGASKALRSAADAGAVAAGADKLAGLFAKINAETFPKGSADGSRSKPEIWDQWDDFTAKVANAVNLAKAIGAKARAGEDTAELVKSFGKNACGSCHRPYRKPKQRS